MEEILMNAELEMEKAIENLEKRFNNIRAGRANPAILNKVQVEYYGVMSPINQVATISVVLIVFRNNDDSSNLS